MFLQSALPFIFCALASAASIPSPTQTLSQPLNASLTTRTRWVIPHSQVTLDIDTWPEVAGTADQVQSVLDDVITTISNSEHYPAGVFYEMKVAVVPDMTYFFVRKAPSLFQQFTYEMAALVVGGLRFWLTIYAGTIYWPTLSAYVCLDGRAIGYLRFAKFFPNDTVPGAIELLSGVPVPPAVAMPLTLPMGFVSAQSSTVEAA